MMLYNGDDDDDEDDDGAGEHLDPSVWRNPWQSAVPAWPLESRAAGLAG